LHIFFCFYLLSKKNMKDYQHHPPVDSLPRVQRIRNIPIERIPSPNNNPSEIINTTIPKLNEEDRFRLHSNKVERKIVPGATFLPKVQHHPPHHRNNHGIVAEHHRHFDGFRENQIKQHPNSHHHPHQQQYYNLRTTPFGESLRHRNTPGSYEQQHQQPSAGIQLVAQYGVQDTGHSTASTPSASKPKLFPSIINNRGGSLPTSHSITLPSHTYNNNYRYQMPARHHPPIPHHHRHHHNNVDENIVPEIEATGLPQDPEIEAERQEADYHLVESGSDILLSTKEDVPEPAPSSGTNNTGGRPLTNVLETAIVDSSCSSDEDDDVVRNCDIEGDGNAKGMNHDDDSIGTSADEQDEKEFQELLERELIVEKYERGPEAREVESWENPDFELYKVTDRYGFVHKTEDEIEADKRQKENDRIKKELRREAKWLRMIDEWKARHPAKLPERIWKGVPEKLRATVRYIYFFIINT
jgi:hypothetical protein